MSHTILKLMRILNEPEANSAADSIQQTEAINEPTINTTPENHTPAIYSNQPNLFNSSASHQTSKHPPQPAQEQNENDKASKLLEEVHDILSLFK